jgi:ABC-type transport system substrate-binding protein
MQWEFMKAAGPGSAHGAAETLGTDGSGTPRAVSETTPEPPLGSGAYRIKSFEAGRSIIYERAPNYWAKDLPINVGTNNFREHRFDYFRDPDVAFEAFIPPPQRIESASLR